MMRKIILFLICWISASYVWADVIYLKSGGSIEGKITGNTADSVEVEAGIGIAVKYYKDEIIRIEERPALKKEQLVGSQSLGGKIYLSGKDKLLSLLEEQQDLPEPDFVLYGPGLDRPLDYTQYGKFESIGKKGYKYSIHDPVQLDKDIGAGIFPNFDGIRHDPEFQAFREQGLLREPHWKVLKSQNHQRAFYIWTQAREDPGVKLFFIGQILEKAGHIIPALKAYYAAVVHFPQSAGWAEDQSFVWYIAPAAMGHIKRIVRDYPSIGYDYVEAKFSVRNGKDTNLKNDIFKVNPGKFVKRAKERKAVNLDTLKVVRRRGNGKVRLLQYSNGHWQMHVNGRPVFIRGISYTPTEVGIGPQNDSNFDARWMFSDKNNNGKIDAPYDAWVDINGNGRQDPDEPGAGDFALLKEMGANAVRLYIPNKSNTEYDPSLINKPLLRDLYDRFGIYVMAGDFLGAYTVGSGASWEAGTDYRDAKQRQQMKAIVRKKVLDLKDEPFVLMWILGNENNLPADYTGINASRTNANAYPKEYAKFLNEVAAMIHELDPDHPVAVGNEGLDLTEYYKKYAPEIDILGVNSYPGSKGFGLLWEDARNRFDRPVLITEYGADAYSEGEGLDEESQYLYHKGNLRDIVANMAGGTETGNAIGGVIFEYLDEWWKDTQGHSVSRQQRKAQWPAAFPDGRAHEEWFGIAGQGRGKSSPFERHLRKAYFFYKEMWGD